MEVTSPPTMTMARGRSSSEPAKPKSIGSSPRIAAPAVISLGLTRPTAASRSAASKGSPAAIRPRVWLISTRLFCTATPKRPMSPTIELAFQVSPVSQSA